MLLCKIDDKVDTGTAGHTFLKLNCGMTEILRPTLYGAYHPILTMNRDINAEETAEFEKVIIVGHCCESGDILTPKLNNGEMIEVRQKNIPFHIYRMQILIFALFIPFC